MNPDPVRVAASFRDPSGFLFQHHQSLYRQVNQVYQSDYDQLLESGLYASLVADRILIPHQEVSLAAPEPDLAYKIIRPDPVDFISYPYEWSFSQLKDAALATLEIQQRALEYGMLLKDASAYNIQFHQGRPTFIDTLSFQVYQEGETWDAYRQFCQHFLAPLALMAYRDAGLNRLLQVHIDGLPLDLASKLLPFRTRFSFSLLGHIHFHASAQKKYTHQAGSKTATKRKMSRNSLVGLISSLKTAVSRLQWQAEGAWAGYYDDTNYTDEAVQHKTALVDSFLNQAAPARVWDLGANTGRYSRIASEKGIPTLAFDMDPGTVEMNYLQCKRDGTANLLPLVIDLTNPSPGIGWQHRERPSLMQRAQTDLVMALALIHHLAIGNNVPLPQVASFFADIAPWLLIEFVPKQDSQVQRLLATRKDIFSEYSEPGFEKNFSQQYEILAKEPLQDSERTLYLMRRLS